MDKTDLRNVYSISDAIIDRFTQVVLKPPSRTTENKIINYTLQKIDREYDRSTNRLTDVFKRRWRNTTRNIVKFAPEYLTAMERIREIGENEGCDACAIGARSTVNLFRNVFNKVNAGAKDISVCIDEEFTQFIIKRVINAPLEILHQIISENILEGYTSSNRDLVFHVNKAHKQAARSF